MQLSTGLSRNYEIEVKRESEQAPGLIDIFQAWLEREDSFGDGLLGYGVCCGAFLFLIMQVVRALMFL